MATKKRNKALAVIDGRIKLAEQEMGDRWREYETANTTLKSLVAAREQVAKAYERPGKPKQPSKAAEVAATIRRRLDTPDGFEDDTIPEAQGYCNPVQVRKESL